MVKAPASLLQRVFAWLLAKLSPAIHKFLTARKREAFAEALKGNVQNVVEVGMSRLKSFHTCSQTHHVLQQITSEVSLPSNGCLLQHNERELSLAMWSMPFCELKYTWASVHNSAGIGSGENMQYYAQHPGIAVTGVDPNAAFREYSISNAEKHGLHSGRFTWMKARNVVHGRHAQSADFSSRTVEQVSSDHEIVPTLMQGSGENLPLPDHCCDALITTMVR